MAAGSATPLATMLRVSRMLPGQCIQRSDMDADSSACRRGPSVMRRRDQSSGYFLVR